ncbi:AAA family ATPase [Lysinibacillus fusiformis]|uniref:AAA family ATPase n=1 Tax=Lysinibacillus fusiformis TaxID=28031 RepID=UPI00215AF1DA|nr:SMC family ATPase [Lysinibacillus fusiformis]MCR8855658.1 SMC family ATPase [Lysinibacillus fusiformis]
MKITSLTIQAFRGFNEKETFNFQNADMIVIYGPNGHGKSSLYDAIEWGLTGGIRRFDDPTPERKRTRFIRNLHTNPVHKTFVKIGVTLADGSCYFIERECTASIQDRTDYGKHELRLFDENNQLYLKGEDAENRLKKWLIHQEWLHKIDSPTTMLGLTHILSQEKISEFLRGMQERDRYDAISTIFGTDYLDKYREGFRITRNTLNNELEKLIVQINGKIPYQKKLEDEIKILNAKESNDLGIEFDKEVKNYLDHYPELKPSKDDLGEILKSIINNQNKIVVKKRKFEKENQILIDIKESIPKILINLKEYDACLEEEKLLISFKKSALSKLKLDQLISKEKVIKNERDEINSFKDKKKDIQLRLENLLIKKESLISAVNLFNISLTKGLWKNNLNFLSEIRNKINEEEYNIINVIYIKMIAEFKMIEDRNVRSQEYRVQLKSLESSLEVIKETNEIYNDFLSSVNKYITIMSEENINACPTCGTIGVKKADILDNIQTQQLQVNEKLPELEKLVLQTLHKIKKLEKDKEDSILKIEDLERSIREILNKFQKEVQLIDIKISTEQKHQETMQQKIDSLSLNLNQFEDECRLLGIKIEQELDFLLEEKKLETIKELEKIHTQRKMNLEKSVQLGELKYEDYDISCIEDYERELQNVSKLQEKEIKDFKQLVQSIDLIESDIEKLDLDIISTKVEAELLKMRAKLDALEKLEMMNINLQNMIELNSEKMRLIKLQEELVLIKSEIADLKNKEEEMNNDMTYLLELMNKSNEALSSLNEKMFINLKETIQTIFAQINSHPIFTKLDLEFDKYRNNNCLTIKVSQENQDTLKANAPYVFSSAQVNSIALSLFLAMALKQKWSPLQLIGIDDPIQSMDEVNIISFIDLMRLFIKKYGKQIIISTHDESFYKLIIKKFRYFNLTTIKYKDYGYNGPTMDVSKIGFESENYENAKEKLKLLDTKWEN